MPGIQREASGGKVQVGYNRCCLAGQIETPAQARAWMWLIFSPSDIR